MGLMSFDWVVTDEEAGSELLILVILDDVRSSDDGPAEGVGFSLLRCCFHGLLAVCSWSGMQGGRDPVLVTGYRVVVSYG